MIKYLCIHFLYTEIFFGAVAGLVSNSIWVKAIAPENKKKNGVTL